MRVIWQSTLDKYILPCYTIDGWDKQTNERKEDTMSKPQALGEVAYISAINKTYRVVEKPAILGERPRTIGIVPSTEYLSNDYVMLAEFDNFDSAKEYYIKL